MRQSALTKLWQLDTNFSILLGLPFNQNDSISRFWRSFEKYQLVYVCTTWFEAHDSFSPGDSGLLLKFYSPLALHSDEMKKQNLLLPRSFRTFLTHFQWIKSDFFLIIQKSVKLFRNVTRNLGGWRKRHFLWTHFVNTFPKWMPSMRPFAAFTWKSREKKIDVFCSGLKSKVRLYSRAKVKAKAKVGTKEINITIYIYLFASLSLSIAIYEVYSRVPYSLTLQPGFCSILSFDILLVNVSIHVDNFKCNKMISLSRSSHTTLLCIHTFI